MCEADEVEVVFWPVHGGSVISQIAAYGTERTDTDYAPDGTEICGDTDNGFGLLFNWNRLKEREYDVAVFVDGELFNRATVFPVNLGQGFLRGASGHYVLEDFPSPGESIVVEWEESLQNFLITDHAP